MSTMSVDSLEGSPTKGSSSRWGGLGSVLRPWVGGLSSLFDFVSLLFLLALSLTHPLSSILFLGYLVRVGGSVATAGLVGAWSGSERAGHVGRWMLIGGICFLPCWIARTAAEDAAILDPGSASALGWSSWSRFWYGLWLFQGLVVGLRGGAASYYVRPVANVRWLLGGLLRWGWYRERWQTWRRLVGSWGMIETLSLGVRAYLGTLAWLLVPGILLGLGPRWPLLGLVGGLMLAWLSLHLPILQVRFAIENRLRVFGEIGESRRLRRQAPMAMAGASLVWLLTGVPLYVLLIEPFAWGLLWLPALAFALLLLLARWAWGAAVGRAMRRTAKANVGLRVVGWILSLLMGLLYAGVVFLSPYLMYRGWWGHFEHHSLLFPVLG